MTHLEPLNALRIGDDEREQVAAALADHYSAGRLTLDEFTTRSEAASRARTHLDLLRITGDLPRGPRTAALPVGGEPRHPARSASGVWPAVLIDLFFGVFGPLALVCLLLLLGASGRDFVVAFFAALGGAVSFGALVHFGHRALANVLADERRSLRP